MLRHFLTCLFALGALAATAEAGHHYYFPSHAFAGRPVVYAAPVVSYQPAYVVPSSFVSVQSYPVSTVTYSTQYYAPMVPVVSNVAVAAVPATSFYSPQSVLTPVGYVAPGYYGRHGRYRRFRGVEVEIERDGDIEIDYKYR